MRLMPDGPHEIRTQPPRFRGDPPELREDELADLIRVRLEMRRPQHLPTRFLPPGQQAHRGRWAVALAASVALVFLALATATQPATTIMLSGLFGHLVPAAASPSPTSAPTTGTSRGQHAAPGVGSTPAAPSPADSPTPTPAAAQQPTPTPAAAAQPTPTSSGSGSILPLPLPSLPPLLPTPTPAPSPTPKKCILGLICL
jgi:hypothetical protein